MTPCFFPATITQTSLPRRLGNRSRVIPTFNFTRLNSSCRRWDTGSAAENHSPRFRVSSFESRVPLPNSKPTTRDSIPPRGYGFPTYLFVQRTPSFADGVFDGSLMIPAPLAKLMTFCHPLEFISPQAGMAFTTVE